MYSVDSCVETLLELLQIYREKPETKFQKRPEVFSPKRVVSCFIEDSSWRMCINRWVAGGVGCPEAVMLVTGLSSKEPGRP